ncbi:E3 ubiquitin-protein ligase COP1-like isoform X1 [Agrilus planipennis]|uniref:E3 ubiquitin-protein ligase COP1-like isoform X1 n=1 Tax=Agrilus planipennis TaxID=224129 RepID=A0A7F5QVB5_AGRPL|nr:E3 ubiquitin-protein ligase COP1-like isoform X1 [Agrilus planipennis]
MATGGHDGRGSAGSTHSFGSNPTTRSSVRTPKRQRSAPGSSQSTEEKSDFLCPVCFNLIEEAHITKCGHTFCYSCILKCIETMKRCPKCNSPLLSAEQIFPNFLLNDVIKKHKMRMNGLESLGLSRESSNEFSTLADGLRDFIASESQNLTLPDVNIMLEILTQRKQLLEAESCAAQNKLLLEFLKLLLQQKEEQKNQIIKEVNIIKHDIDEVERILREVHSKCPTLEDVERAVGSASDGDSAVRAMKKEMIEIIDNIESTTKKDDASFVPQAGSESTKHPGLSSLATRRRRMHAHFEDFVQCYFTTRSKDLFFKDTEKSPKLTESSSSLNEFRENLVKFSRYNSLRPLATLNYSNDLFNNSTIVSSIEFDKDNEFFAIAGVTKRIKVFDYNAVIQDSVDIHYPCMEMVSSSKISCVSWNSYHKGTLASSDYEGTVTIWDASTGQRTKTFQEHEKRCWSVDFNDVDTRLIASGSDDARVKLYSLNVEHSIATLEAKANVCCVKFNPRSSCHLAFGSADHCVHYYDLRNMKEPVSVFKGHKKAVSYVKFLNSEEIVSASTDSQLKLWNINTPYCLRSFVGHINEKNFVGLATDGDYVACGSENNALYIYYKGLTKKLFSYKFEATRGVLENERREDEPNEFVSAVCWKQHSNVVVAANSQGTINILELV